MEVVQGATQRKDSALFAMKGQPSGREPTRHTVLNVKTNQKGKENSMAWKTREVTVPTDTIKVGDLIKFKAVTRWSSRAVWRKVTSVSPSIQVRYGGWGNFYVRDYEITDLVRT